MTNPSLTKEQFDDLITDLIAATLEYADCANEWDVWDERMERVEQDAVIAEMVRTSDGIGKARTALLKAVFGNE